ncbi:MAG TPA: M23 family metallopeptidase, partial [bacterium]
VPRGAVRPAVRPGFLWPSRGVITSRFGFRGRRHHHGIDIAAPVGTPIMAARDGVVTFAGMQGGYGQLVVLDHGDGLTTWYGHASTVIAVVGQRVQRGELIARVGTTGHVTGPNLHFEVRRNNTPLDPLPFLWRAR